MSQAAPGNGSGSARAKGVHSTAGPHAAAAARQHSADVGANFGLNGTQKPTTAKPRREQPLRLLWPVRLLVGTPSARHMTQTERMPLAVLAGLLSGDTILPTVNPQPNKQGAEWWAQKKRKRTVSCGRCSACCREDCGKCVNCADKPRYGGQGALPGRPYGAAHCDAPSHPCSACDGRRHRCAEGRRAWLLGAASDRPRCAPLSTTGIRKQSCLERKCQNASAPTVAPSCSSQAASSSLAKAPALVIRQLPKLADKAELQAKAGTMPPQEWNDFWSAVECCMRLQVPWASSRTSSLHWRMRYS